MTKHASEGIHPATEPQVLGQGRNYQKSKAGLSVTTQKDFYLPISFFFKEQVVLQVEGHTVTVWERELTDKTILRTII